MLELLEFFQLTPLQGPILKCLDMMLESIYQDVQLHFRNAAGKSNFVSLLDFKSIDTIRQLCDSAPTIFKFDTAPWLRLQDSCVRLFSDTFWSLTMDKSVHHQLQNDCPEFLARLWNEMTSPYQIGLVLPMLPARCVTCNEDPLDATANNYFHHLSTFQLIGHPRASNMGQTSLNVELVCNECHSGGVLDPGRIMGKAVTWSDLIPRSQQAV